jgi:predicted transcriptional regulator
MANALTVELDGATLNALDRLAQRTERSRNSLIAEAVQDFVEVNAWQLQKIESGLAAADRGEFASEAEVARVRAKFAPRA